MLLSCLVSTQCSTHLEIFNLMQTFGVKKVSSCLYHTFVMAVSCRTDRRMYSLNSLYTNLSTQRRKRERERQREREGECLPE